MKLRHVLLALVTLLFVASAVMAQPRGGPPGRDPSQALDNMIRQLDKNGDGVITPDEVDPQFRLVYERMASRAGLDPTKPIKVQDLKDAMQNRGPRGGGPGGGPGGPPAAVASGTRPGQTPASSVPGFGVEAKPVAVPGFSPSAAGGASPGSASAPPSGGKPVAKSPSSSGYSSTLTSGRKSYRLSTPQERPVPKGLPAWFIEKDVHQNGQITMFEWGAGKTWTDELAGDFAKYDLNNDGIITDKEAIKAEALIKAGLLATVRPAGGSGFSPPPARTISEPPAAASLEAMYALPQGGVDDHVKFINTLTAYKPQTPEEDLAYRVNYRRATSEAAEKILKENLDPNSIPSRTARYTLLLNRIYALAQGTPQEQQKTLDDAKAYMEERIKNGRGIAGVTVAMSLGQTLEQMGEYQRAADALREFAEMTAKSGDRNLSGATDQMRQTAERLAAAAKDFRREGQKLVLLPKGRLIPLDLSRQANLDIETFGANAGSGLAEIPRGWTSLGGVKFQVGARVIQLAGDQPRGGPEARGRPAKVEGIAVDRKIVRLYVLHSGQWGGVGGTPVGEYRLHYEDGSSTAFPIIYGEDLCDWYTRGSQFPATRARVVWTGNNLNAGNARSTLRLCLSGWENPHPDKKVTSLDYVSTSTRCAPFCVAITVEEPDGAR